MASRRQSLKALAEERGFTILTVERVSPPGIPGWYAGANDDDHYDSIDVEAPTRRAAEAGLRACLESMPLKRKGRG